MTVIDPPVSVASVLASHEPASSFLCPLSANTYNIDFLSFTISVPETNEKLFHISKEDAQHASDPEHPPMSQQQQLEALALAHPEIDIDAYRSIHYSFTPSFLNHARLVTTLRFSVGPRELSDFTMIERHYSRRSHVLIKSYEFKFTFVMPSSVNEWSADYEMPQLSDETKRELLEDGSCSDSFYFVGQQLVMHNRATYDFNARESDSAGASTSADQQTTTAAQ